MAIPRLRRGFLVRCFLLLCAFTLVIIMVSNWRFMSSDGASYHSFNSFSYEQWRLSGPTQDTSFSACLLVMDDNHFLIEWIPFHYHVLPLRHLVVAVDPRSSTSPAHILDRWRRNMTIVEWTDDDYMTPESIRVAEEALLMKSPDLEPQILRHRARQRLFYYKCMLHHKANHRGWTLLSDTDEFLYINYNKTRELGLAAPPIDQPGSIMMFLNQQVRRPESNLSSPCVQIPRNRFGGLESPLEQVQEKAPPGFNASAFQTLRWHKHAGPGNHVMNRISKTILDLSRIETSAIEPVESIHRPIKAYCSQRRLHIRRKDSVFIMNHYLGTWEQFSYRDDARTDARSKEWYNKYKRVNAADDDEITPWLDGFVRHTGVEKSSAFLRGVGALEPKHQLHSDPAVVGSDPKCALLFFGLPRSFKTLVLPSIVKNLLAPNAHHNCDIFVHYFNRTLEPKGRKNYGGNIDPGEILLLKGAVHQVAMNTSKPPTVEFCYDTEDDFWMKRNASIQKYRNTLGPDGKKLYFPWAARSYEFPVTMDNVVRQWHSIDAAWMLMERAMAADASLHYSRVGMFRNDAMYLTPIDIYKTDLNTEDEENKFAVIPPFGHLPTNDRMMYGPYDAVKIWSTKRFELVEKHVRTYEPGWGMHSEHFLKAAIFPAINETGFDIISNPDVCFLRTRAEDVVVATDCTLFGATRGFGRANVTSIVESVLGRKCLSSQKWGRFLMVKCGLETPVAST